MDPGDINDDVEESIKVGVMEDGQDVERGSSCNRAKNLSPKIRDFLCRKSRGILYEIPPYVNTFSIIHTLLSSCKGKPLREGFLITAYHTSIS